MTPVWIPDVFAAAMLAVAAVSAARIVVARPWRCGSIVIDADVAHLLMAIAMAGILAPRLSALPGTAWDVIFPVMIGWFAYLVLRDTWVNGIRALAGGHCAPHFVHSASMLYMFLAMPDSAGAGAVAGVPGSSGIPTQTLSHPTFALAFAFILIAYAIWDLDQLSGGRYNVVSARLPVAAIAAPGVPVMAGAESVTAEFSAARPAVSAVAADHEPGVAGGRAVTCGGDADHGAQQGALGEFLLSPAVTVTCRVAMGVAMAFMLLIAI
jgi:hypothetical protein